MKYKTARVRASCRFRFDFSCSGTMRWCPVTGAWSCSMRWALNTSHCTQIQAPTEMCQHLRSRPQCIISQISLQKSRNGNDCGSGSSREQRFRDQMLAIERLFELRSCNCEQAFVRGSCNEPRGKPGASPGESPERDCHTPCVLSQSPSHHNPSTGRSTHTGALPQGATAPEHRRIPWTKIKH